MAAKKSVSVLKEADLKGKRVFVRVDLNVPLDDNLNITDDNRVRAAVPTIKYLMGHGAKVILSSHLVYFSFHYLNSCVLLSGVLRFLVNFNWVDLNFFLNNFMQFSFIKIPFFFSHLHVMPPKLLSPIWCISSVHAFSFLGFFFVFFLVNFYLVDLSFCSLFL